MKHNIQHLAFFIAAIAVSALSGCGKSGSSPVKQKDTTTTTTTLHPVSSTFVQTGGVPITYQYTYDNDNNLAKIGSADGTSEIAINAHTVVQTSITTEFDDVDTYSYSGPSNTPVDIYTSLPAQLSISNYTKNNADGSSTTIPGKLWAFQGSGNNITQLATSDAGGETIDITYDTHDNFKTISYTSLSGTRAGQVFATLTVTAVDNHPSPFSAVKGYNVFSYPQSFAPDFALAYCKNNPTQILYKQFDYDKGDFEVTEQDDFTYIYNTQGYPTSVTVKVTYTGPPVSVYTKTYTYTYK